MPNIYRQVLLTLFICSAFAQNYWYEEQTTPSHQEEQSQNKNLLMEAYILLKQNSEYLQNELFQNALGLTLKKYNQEFDDLEQAIKKFDLFGNITLNINSEHIKSLEQFNDSMVNDINFIYTNKIIELERQITENNENHEELQWRQNQSEDNYKKKKMIYDQQDDIIFKALQNIEKATISSEEAIYFNSIISIQQDFTKIIQKSGTNNMYLPKLMGTLEILIKRKNFQKDQIQIIQIISQFMSYLRDIEMTLKNDWMEYQINQQEQEEKYQFDQEIVDGVLKEIHQKLATYKSLLNIIYQKDKLIHFGDEIQLNARNINLALKSLNFFQEQFKTQSDKYINMKQFQRERKKYFLKQFL